MNRCRSLSTHLGRVISGVEYRHRETETVVITKVVDKRGGRKKERAVVRPGQKGTRVSSRSRMDPGCMLGLRVSRLQLELEVGVSWVSGVRLRVGHAASLLQLRRHAHSIFELSDHGKGTIELCFIYSYIHLCAIVETMYSAHD